MRVSYTEECEALWCQVWRRVGKCAAYKEWQRLDEEDQQLALEVVSVHAMHYASNDLQFRPHLRTWLHQRRFEDELTDPMQHERERQAQIEQWGYASGPQRI